MKKNKNILASAFFIFLMVFSISCKKNWLDAKPKQSLLVPDNIKDLQSTLDNTNYFSTSPVGLHEAGANDYYLTNTYFLSKSEKDRNVYSWASSVSFYGGSTVGDWDLSYERLFVANTVLENIEKIEQDINNKSDWDNIKGSALFFRAWLMYNIAQVFCKPYIPASAASDYGIIVRLSPDILLPAQRATVQQTYDQIIADLLASLPLVPVTPFNGWKTRPTKPAVMAMLARVYLAMQNYDKAREFADQCLSIYSALMDYNTDPSINPAAQYPFARYNPEVLFHGTLPQVTMMPQVSTNGYVDSTLYLLYADNDLRKSLFYDVINGRLAFKGGYEGSGSSTGSILSVFNGLATDEVYLIKAECQARRADISGAMQTLDILYRKRWDNVLPYQPFTASNEDEALNKIFIERRKELCFRGIRWTDLRRLNQDTRFAITLTRGLLNATTIFTLPPNDNRYVYPIPESEILFNNIPQNPR